MPEWKPGGLALSALLAMMAAAAGPRLAFASAAEAGRLDPGRPVEGVLAAGEVRAYAVDAPAGGLLAITVDERGGDLSVRLHGAEGSLIQAADSPGTADGLMRLSSRAEAAASYRLELRATAAGRFQVALRARVLAPGEAEPWLAAERAWSRAQELHDAGEAGRRRALQLYQEALAAWRRLGHPEAEAETLTMMAAVGGFLEEPRRKLDSLRQALPLWRTVGNRYREAWTLAEIGVAHGVLGAPGPAREHHEQALAAWRALGDERGEAQALIALGAYHEDLGDMQAALDLVSQGHALGRRLGDRRVEAEALRRLAGVRRAMGETRQAIDLMEESRALWQAVGDRYREALALANLATGYRETGRHAKALETLQSVLAMAREQGHVHLTAAALANLGTHHRLRQEHEAARAYYAQAQALFRRQGQPWDESQVLRRLGEIDEAEGRWPAAAERYQEALRLSRQTASAQAESEVLYCLARLERGRGRLDDAAAHIGSALAIVEGLRASVARQDFRTAYLASVLRFYELAIDVSVDLDRARPGEGHAAAALRHAERARARSFLESLGEAQGHIKKGADAELLARRRGLDRALRERAAHVQQRPSAAAREMDALVEQLREVEAAIRRTSPRYADLVLPQPLELGDIQKEIPDEETLLLEYAQGEERSHLWLVTRSTLRLVALPRRSEIEELARRFHGLFQTQKFETEDERRARRRRAKAEYPRLAAALSEAVLGPAAPWLDRKRLVIVADGALQYVPFAALHLPQGHPARRRGGAPLPLVTAHEVVSLPSASTLAVLPRAREAVPPTVAVVADPVYDAADPRVVGGGRKAGPLPPALQRSLDDVAPGRRLARLAFTRKEAEAILALVPASARKAALDFEASRQTVESGDLARYDIVHVATHSLINGIHPELSGLVLSLVDRQGRAQDGFLRAHQIFDLDLDARLVVLSGCSTGLGRETRGEGLAGLTRGFMYAGAARVVVSLWDVHDEATAAFMKRFYGGLLGQGLSPAAALRAAQLASLRDRRWSAPDYWAPFVLQGEWRW